MWLLDHAWYLTTTCEGCCGGVSEAAEPQVLIGGCLNSQLGSGLHLEGLGGGRVAFRVNKMNCTHKIFRMVSCQHSSVLLSFIHPMFLKSRQHGARILTTLSPRARADDDNDMWTT